MARRILLVEPDDEVRQLLAEALTEMGFAVSCPIDSYVGIEMASQQGFDLIILCDHMPIIDGPGFYRHLYDCGAAPPTIVLCDSQTDPQGFRYPAHDALASITKPFQMADLKDLVHTLIKKT